MLFTNSKSFINMTITINNVSNKHIHTARFIGMILDDKMTWKDHISYMSNKLGTNISILNRVNWKHDSRALRLLYYTLVLPCISYCAIISGNTNYKNVLPIFDKQKRYSQHK